jgi:hypothetical protein
MTDRELLEFAAKAAGIEFSDGYFWSNNGDAWNPLADDGDALRLAVRLRMCVEPWGSGAAAVVTVNNRALVAEPHYGDDPERATRRAIVRAAAEIGRQMP